MTFDNSVSHSQTPCEDLQRLSLRDEAFNREVAIVSATVKQGSATVPTHCEVRGVIWPEINF
ncbi:MAG: hypothetical protein QXZ09_06665, partial [Candidatus Methanomethylicaceae archaeon]